MNEIVKAEASIKINAPVEKVFAYMEDPTNLPAIWSSMIDVTNVVEETKCKKYDWTYNMAGMIIHRSAGTIEHESNKRIVVKTSKAHYYNARKQVLSVSGN